MKKISPDMTALALCLSAALLSGCALPVTPEQIIESKAAVGRAVDAGGATHAASELRRAQNKLALTERWVAAGDTGPARWLAEQAQVDAEFAHVKALSARAQTQAARAQQELRALGGNHGRIVD